MGVPAHLCCVGGEVIVCPRVNVKNVPVGCCTCYRGAGRTLTAWGTEHTLFVTGEGAFDCLHS